MSTALKEKSNEQIATVVKPRKTSKGADDPTVEDHLIQEFEELERKVRDNTNAKLQVLQAEFLRLKGEMLKSSGVNDGDNAYEITFKAVEGPYKGQMWVRNLKLRNPTKSKRGKAKKNNKSDTASFRIGRSKAVQFVKYGVSLPLDDEVSTTHAEVVLRRGRGLFIEDRASTNGTCVNGTALEAMQPVALMDGQKITFGGLTSVVVDIRSIE